MSGAVTHRSAGSVNCVGQHLPSACFVSQSFTGREAEPHSVSVRAHCVGLRLPPTRFVSAALTHRAARPVRPQCRFAPHLSVSGSSVPACCPLPPSSLAGPRVRAALSVHSRLLCRSAPGLPPARIPAGPYLNRGAGPPWCRFAPTMSVCACLLPSPVSSQQVALSAGQRLPPALFNLRLSLGRRVAPRRWLAGIRSYPVCALGPRLLHLSLPRSACRRRVRSSCVEKHRELIRILVCLCPRACSRIGSMRPPACT